MADFVVSPVGSDGNNNVDSLAQDRVYAGEVLSAFIATNIMEKFVHVKTLTSGESMRFPVVSTGKASDVKTHVAGTEIDINTGAVGEKVIVIGELEYDSRFIDNKQKKVLDFDITSPFTKALGQSLAQKLDKTLFALLPVADRHATKSLGVAGQGDGSVLIATDIASASTAEERGNAIKSAIFKANVTMNLNNVPQEGRVCVLDASSWDDLSQATNIRNRDFTTQNGGIDVYNGDMLKVGNTMVIWSNNLTLTIGDIGWVFTADAIGLVKFINIITESTYQELRFGNVITARYCYGADILNPACVVGIRDRAI